MCESISVWMNKWILFIFSKCVHKNIFVSYFYRDICIFILLFGLDVLHKTVLIVELCCVAVTIQDIHGLMRLDIKCSTQILHIYTFLKSQINVIFDTKGLQHDAYNDCLNYWWVIKIHNVSIKHFWFIFVEPSTYVFVN